MDAMQTIVTHSGNFHADEVLAVATLKLLLNEPARVVRTRDEKLIATADWVVDVGGVYDHQTKRYDHHQPSAPVRENGLPYAAFGLVWRHYGEAVCGSVAVAERLDTTLVQPVDAGDNGVSLYTLNELNLQPFELYQVVGSFAPAWGSGDDKDEAFTEAVAWARGLLTRLIARQNAIQKMEQLVANTYATASDKRVLVFDVPVSAVAVVPYPEVMVVVCPDELARNKNWKATVVRADVSGFASRVSFPAAWAGLRGEELTAVSGIAEAVFCHAGRFLFVAGSKAAALRAAAQAN